MDTLTPKPDVLTILDLDFPIISGWIIDEPSDDGTGRIWTIDILADGDETYDASGKLFNWTPHLSGDDVWLPIASLDALVGETIQVADAYNHAREEHLFSLYVFSHLDVRDSDITILAKQADRLHIQWTGRVDVFYNERYDRDLPFALDTWLTIRKE